ncbi:hypothetical protein CEXT_539701 [Caerostris extrusa]|uniref:Uncharacterized protein n=1 Tax=Caerostris extrusa TaxID=172846 RepID=A0AAV4W5C6_CAEEX|nr:hypothetical protein CEXT_539701 [Caerostris extrusa]
MSSIRREQEHIKEVERPYQLLLGQISSTAKVWELKLQRTSLRKQHCNFAGIDTRDQPRPLKPRHFPNNEDILDVQKSVKTENSKETECFATESHSESSFEIPSQDSSSAESTEKVKQKLTNRKKYRDAVAERSGLLQQFWSEEPQDSGQREKPSSFRDDSFLALRSDPPLLITLSDKFIFNHAKFLMNRTRYQHLPTSSLTTTQIWPSYIKRFKLLKLRCSPYVPKST